MYVVRMKRVTASDARRRWFELLDEVAAGEVLIVERHGRRIVLQREEPRRGSRARVPSYADVLRSPGLDEADRWGWVWTGARQPLRSVRRRTG